MSKSPNIKLVLVIILLAQLLLAPTLTSPEALASLSDNSSAAAEAADTDDAIFFSTSSSNTTSAQSSTALASADKYASDATTPFALVYLPLYSWNQISAQRYPHLYRAMEKAAIGNLVSDDSFIAKDVADRPNISFYDLQGLSSQQANDVIGDLVPDQLEQGVLVVVSSVSFAREAAEPALTPVIVIGGGFSGLLTSSTTRRNGLISASDILYFERQLNSGGDSLVTTPSQAQTKTVFDLTGVPSGQTLKSQLAFLQHNIDICAGIDASTEGMNLMLLALLLLTTACSLVLLFFEINVSPRHLAVLVPLARGLLLVTLSFPIACFLMFLVPPPLYQLTDSAAGMVISCLLWTALLVAVALLIGRLRRWVYSLLFLFVLTFGVLLLDQLAGGPLSLTGYLNYHVNDGIRYYGLGNEAAALLFGSWITFSGVVVNRFADFPLTTAFRRWLFLLASTLIVSICVLPTIGASFGVLVWGVMGIVVCWWLFGGRTITLRLIVTCLSLCLLLAIGTLVADIYFNPYSHMNNVVAVMDQGPGAVLVQLSTSIFYSFWQTVIYSPVLTLVFLLVLAWLVVLAAVKPGTYREFWARNLGFRAAYAAGLCVVLVMCLIEDSGIYMPSLYIVYLLAGFIWLVCDMQTWRARESSADGNPITIRELLTLAGEREGYRQLGQGKDILPERPTTDGGVSGERGETGDGDNRRQPSTVNVVDEEKDEPGDGKPCQPPIAGNSISGDKDGRQ